MITLSGFLLSMVAATVIAQTPGAPSPIPPGSLVDPGLLEFIKVFGFGAMIFIVWWRDARKIDRLTHLAEDYAVLAKNFEKLAEDSRDTALMCARVNTSLVNKLEESMRREARTHEQS